jgi:hypothetical protein
MTSLGRMALVGLGILAYQNRNKIAAMLRRQTGSENGSTFGNDQQQSESQQGGLMDPSTRWARAAVSAICLTAFVGPATQKQPTLG